MTAFDCDFDPVTSVCIERWCKLDDVHRAWRTPILLLQLSILMVGIISCAPLGPPTPNIREQASAPGFVLIDFERYICECIARHEGGDIITRTGQFEDRPALNVDMLGSWRMHVSVAWSRLRLLANENAHRRNVPGLSDVELWDAACLPWGARHHGWDLVVIGRVDEYILIQKRVLALSISLIERRRDVCRTILNGR